MYSGKLNCVYKTALDLRTLNNNNFLKNRQSSQSRSASFTAVSQQSLLTISQLSPQGLLTKKKKEKKEGVAKFGSGVGGASY